MCNLYSGTTSPIGHPRHLRGRHDCSGNLPPLPAIFHNRMAPIIRIGGDGERELLVMALGNAGAASVRHSHEDRRRVNITTLNWLLNLDVVRWA